MSKLDALARGEFAALVLRLDAGLAAAGARIGAAVFEPVENVFHGGYRSRLWRPPTGRNGVGDS